MFTPKQDFPLPSPFHPRHKRGGVSLRHKETLREFWIKFCRWQKDSDLPEHLLPRRAWTLLCTHLGWEENYAPARAELDELKKAIAFMEKNPL